MDIKNLPIVSQVVSFGPESRLFDSLLIAGPLVVILIVFFGRNVFTLAIASSYLLWFVASVVYTGVQRDR